MMKVMYKELTSYFESVRLSIEYYCCAGRCVPVWVLRFVEDTKFVTVWIQAGHC